MIEELWKDWDGSNWVNKYEHTYSYNRNNKVIEQLVQSWDGSIWVNVWKHTYRYDGNNNFSEEFE